MIAYLRSIWDRRYFWLSLVRMDLRSRYRGSVLGMGWSLLHPICMSAILCVVFCTIFKQDPLEFGLYLFAGLTVWNFIRDTMQQGCLAFFHAENYIRQYPAPMAIYPLRTALTYAFHFLMGLVPVVVLAAWRNGALSPQALLFGVVPGVVLLLTLGWSLAVLVGVAFVHFRDTRHITDIAMQVFFYMTPVMYPRDFMRASSPSTLMRICKLMQTYNPLTPFLRLIRDAALNNQLPPLSVYAAACLIVVVMGSAAAISLWNEERQLIFHL
jgi:lipopolysaccharide transport system permease protein